MESILGVVGWRVRRLRLSMGLVVGCACLCTVLPHEQRARAYPFLPPRPVPSAIAGPTDPHPAALYYNPAALGPLTGNHVYLDGGARVHLGSVQLNATEAGPASSTPISWSDLASFVGATTDLRGNEVLHGGIAAYTPYSDFTSYGDSSLRYHAKTHTMAVFGESLAASVRIASRFWIGAAINFYEAWLRYSYDRDAAPYGGSALVDQPNALCGAACGLENSAARQQIDLRGFNWGVGATLGILVRPIDRLWLSLSWITRSYSPGRGPDMALYDDRTASVSPTPNLSGNCTPAGQSFRPCQGNDQISVVLPDIVYFGLRFEATPRFEFEAGARYINYGARNQLDVSLQGGNLASAGNSAATRVPPQFLLDRGFQDTWAFWASGRFRLRETIRLSPMLMFETSAVRTDVVNAASIDSNKLDLSLTAEWKPTRLLRIGAHVGGTAYILGQAGQAFSSRAAVSCVDAAYSLDACGKISAGQGLPSADGQYTMFVLHLGASIGFDF